MSVEHKEKLIDLVKLNPGLWKQSRKAPGLKQKLWDEIGTELGTTGYDARRQWEILRDQLRRENKRFKQNPYYKSKWLFYNKMLFTLPQRDPSSSTQTNEGEPYNFGHQNIHPFLPPKSEDAHVIIKVRKDLQGQGDPEDYHLPLINECAPEYVEMNEDSPSTSAGVSSSTQHSVHIKEDVDINEISETKTKRYSGFPDDGDEDYYFAMSLVPSMRFIPRSKKLRVRSKIMNVIQSVLEEGFEDEQEDYKINVLPN